MGEQTNFADSGRIPPGKTWTNYTFKSKQLKKLVKAQILKATAVV